MSHPVKWQVAKLADLIRRGRNGDIWRLVGKDHGGMTADAVAQIWFRHANEDDQAARTAALRRRVYAPPRHRGPRVEPTTQIGRDPVLRSPEVETFSRNAFGNNASPIEYGRVGQSGLNHSVTGCAAAWAAGEA